MPNPASVLSFKKIFQGDALQALWYGAQLAEIFLPLRERSVLQQGAHKPWFCWESHNRPWKTIIIQEKLAGMLWENQ